MGRKKLNLRWQTARYIEDPFNLHNLIQGWILHTEIQFVASLLSIVPFQQPTSIEKSLIGHSWSSKSEKPSFLWLLHSFPRQGICSGVGFYWYLCVKKKIIWARVSKRKQELKNRLGVVQCLWLQVQVCLLQQQNQQTPFLFCPTFPSFSLVGYKWCWRWRRKRPQTAMTTEISAAKTQIKEKEDLSMQGFIIIIILFYCLLGRVRVLNSTGT